MILPLHKQIFTRAMTVAVAFAVTSLLTASAYAAAWLFGSGLLGRLGIARRKIR
mgnify:CR=1 FL=1